MNNTMYSFENDINRIRLEIYNEQKNLSTDERINQAQKRANGYIAKYGFKIANLTGQTHSNDIK